MTTFAPRSELEKLVKNFGPFPKQTKVLDQQRHFILELRARGGSYPQIRQLLATVGIQVSDASLSKFCCKHRPMIDRLQLEMEGEGVSPITSPSEKYAPPLLPSSSSTPISTLLPQKRSRDLRGPV